MNTNNDDLQAEKESETPTIKKIVSQSTDNSLGQDMSDLIGYDEQIKALEAAAQQIEPETAEQRKQRERRERSKKIISAVGDGISALSNLYFTTQYAPDSFNSHQLGKVNERIEKLKAERDANGDKYNNYMLRIGDVKNAKAKTLRDMQAQHEAQKLAREKAQREAELHPLAIAIKEAQGRKENNQANKAGYEATSAQVEAENAPALQEAKLQTEQARRGSYEASASASRASAANSMASARAHDRSNPKEFSAWDEHGNEHKFRTKDAADRYAKQHGTWQDEEITSSTTTNRDDETNGHSSQTATTTKLGGRPAKPVDVGQYKRGGSTPPPLN